MRKNLLPEVINALTFVCLLAGGLSAGEVCAAGLYQDTTRTKADTLQRIVADRAASGSVNGTTPVLYGNLPKNRLTQSTSTTSGSDLERSPTTLLSNSFAGRLAGLYSLQTNGTPRYSNPILSIRGRRPLIVIDDIPRYDLSTSSETLYDVLSLNPEQIESVTLLKDALSTAMLGNRGMNGVLMVRTKKNEGDNTSITFKAQAGLHTPIGQRKTLSAFDYASLYNEALVNSNLSPIYSQTQLEKYRNGSDPFIYPSVNWQDEVLRDNALAQRYNLSANGKFTNLNYFVSLDYQDQQGLFKEDPNTSYGTNIDYKRYIFRSNLELSIDKFLTANLNLLGNIQDYIQPGLGYQTVFNNTLYTPSLSAPTRNANGTFGGSRLYPRNPYADAVATGYLKNNLQSGTVDLSAKRLMDDVVKGSWIKATISYSPSYEQQINRSKDYDAYYFESSNSGALRVNKISDLQANNANVIARFQQTYAQLFLGYDKTWNKNSFNTLISGFYENDQSDDLLNQIYKGISGRFMYNIAGKYNFEFASAYTSNNWYADGNKGHFYPSVGASWNVGNEDFFSKTGFLNDLKLRASYGRVGNANPGYYEFRQIYTSNSNYFFGTGPTTAGSVSRAALPNPNRVDEKADKLDIGLDLSYAKNRGWFTVDYFNNKQFDLLQQRGNSTAVLGQVYPDENIGKNKYYGYEFSAGWNDNAGQLKYNLSANFSSVASKVLFNDEGTYPYPYLYRTGQPVNQIRGYVADGFFTSGSLSGPTMAGFNPSPGDVRYKDLNNDGVINMLDQTVIANDRPLLFYGLNMAFAIKGFDLNVLFQGVANRDIVSGNNPFYRSLGQAFDINQNRYTQANAASATLPRLTVGTDVNNYITSSLFVQNGNYLRIKNVELGYTFSAKLLTAIKIKQVRVFANGFNLATFSKYKQADPENYQGLYPISRIVNGGLSIKI